MSNLNMPRPDHVDALRAFAKKYGEDWKTKLNDMWFDGKDAREPQGHLLRQVRNRLGPRWLKDFKLD